MAFYRHSRESGNPENGTPTKASNLLNVLIFGVITLMKFNEHRWLDNNSRSC